MKNYTADELNVEGDHVPGERMTADLLRRADQMTAGVFDESERLGKERVEALALPVAILEFLRHPGKIIVGEVPGLVFFFDTVDLMNYGPNFLKLTIILSSENQL
jgi:hypothetical protein